MHLPTPDISSPRVSSGGGSHAAGNAGEAPREGEARGDRRPAGQSVRGIPRVRGEGPLQTDVPGLSVCRGLAGPADAGGEHVVLEVRSQAPPTTYRRHHTDPTCPASDLLEFR